MAGGASFSGKSGVSAAILYRNDAVVITLGAKDSGYDPVKVRQMDAQKTKTSLFTSSIPVTAPIAGGVVFTKIVSLPPMPKREVMPTIALTQKDSLPFPLDDAHIGALVLHSNETHTHNGGVKALVCAIPKTEADRLCRELSRFGLRLKAIIPYVMAISSVIKSEEIKGTVIVVNTEPDRTGIYIFRDGVPLFTRDIPTGATQINDPTFSIISQEIDRSIKSFNSDSPGVAIEAGLLTGFSPHLSEVGKNAEKATGISFSHLKPSAKISFDKAAGDESGFDSTALAPLIGAAIDNGSTLNLLPSAPQRLASFAKSHTRSVKVAAIFLFLSVAAFTFVSYNADLNEKIEKLESDVLYLENEKALYETAQAHLALLTGKNNRLKVTLRQYPSFSVSGYEWRRLFEEVAASVPYNVKLTTLNSNFEPIVAEGSGRNYWTKLSGQIKGSDHEKVEALESLLGGLNRSTLFSSISIVAGTVNRGANGEGELFEFMIKAKTEPGAGSLATKIISENGEG